MSKYSGIVFGILSLIFVCGLIYLIIFGALGGGTPQPFGEAFPAVFEISIFAILIFLFLKRKKG